jgi:G2/mitotic-specific cyclin 2
MIDYLARKEVLHEAFFKKYAAKKYMKASILVRQWIRTEYVEEEEIKAIEYEEKGKENTPDEEDKENENDVSDEDDYMFANELEEREVDSFQEI